MRIIYEEPKDERVNVSRPSGKEFLMIWIIITICCASNFFLYLHEMDIGMEPWLIALTSSANVSFLALVASFLFRFVSRKMNNLGQIQEIATAARRVAKGDFTVQVHHQRRDGRYDETDALVDDFNVMVEELSSIQTLKGDFIANVSHEIKTPLAIIENYAQALQRKHVTKEEQEEYLATIQSAASRLSSLVSNVLRLNRMESQKILDIHEYDLAEQLRCCTLNFLDQIDEKEIELNMEIPDNIAIVCDESLMELVWNNLINNAVKFAPCRGIITIDLQQLPTELIVSVTDSGCGMTDETARHIFDKFYQGDTSHACEGNGLGLAMVARVMELVEGEIQVKSQLQKGTSFAVHLKRGTDEKH